MPSCNDFWGVVLVLLMWGWLVLGMVIGRAMRPRPGVVAEPTEEAGDHAE